MRSSYFKFPLEFIEPRNTGMRKPRHGKEIEKTGTTDNLLFKIKLPTVTFISIS